MTSTHRPDLADRPNKHRRHYRRRTTRKETGLIPIILCAGEHGRALVYGYVQSEPIPGQPVRMERARMVLMYPSGGTFGLAADGPPSGSRVTHAVEVTTETRWQEWLKVSPTAAEVFDGWK